METKNMSANPHSVVHARQFTDVEKSKDEQPRKSEPGVKGVVSWCELRESAAVFLWVIAALPSIVSSSICFARYRGVYGLYVWFCGSPVASWVM